MDPPENSNVTEKLWDHAWTTEEMRQHRNNWSLAADAGLLKHLQQFSDNLTEQVQRTQEKLNSLASDLNEASVIIDNVTNASLALANTQFIESRVYEDDVETTQAQDTIDQNINNEQHDKENLIACVSESIKQCLSIMDEKFQRVEVLPSDSEDEGEAPTPSVVLQPKDPYKNRPLPYAIGTESDSEPPESDEDSKSEIEHEKHENQTTADNLRESPLRRTLSSSSESSHRQERANITKNYSEVSSKSEKIEARSQDTFNSGSEITTPGIVQHNVDNSMSRGEPSFAEELAKRLGNVSNRPIIKDSQEADQSSINRSKDDLFAPSYDNDVFGSKSENLFSDDENLFDDASTSLWKNKPYKAPKTNIIPPSLDVPPPMTAEATKPRSAFDDLCGDADSEDSDDIFAPKSGMVKNMPPRSTSASNEKSEIESMRENKLLNVVHSENAMATSTPETHDNGGLFGDDDVDENDDDDLFGSSVKSHRRLAERSPEETRASNRTMPPGLAITQEDILSSNLGSRLFQRMPQQNSSDSSDADPSLMRNPDFRVNDALITESDSSGISIRPNSINTTSGLGVDFQPQSESTRLRSEEIFRERRTSDSLFEGRTSRHPEGTNSTENSDLGPHDARIVESPEIREEDDFDSDDVFGPPPLSNEDARSKSEVTSNEDLFSTSDSYVSRPGKSFDLLASKNSQYDSKNTSKRSGGLFDEDIDIFGDGADAPEVDIFGEAFKSTLASRSNDEKTKNETSSVVETTESRKTSDLFDTSKTKNAESSLFREIPKKLITKPNSIFDDSENDDDDDDDLFSVNFLKSERKIIDKKMHVTNDDEIFADTDKNAGETSSYGTKKDSTSNAEQRSVESAKDISTNHRVVERSNDEKRIERVLPNYSSGGGLFDNLEDDVNDNDDNPENYDSLFASINTKKSNDKATSKKVEENIFSDNEMSNEASPTNELKSQSDLANIEKPNEKATSADENKMSGESNTKESKFKSNLANIEKLLKEKKVVDASEKKKKDAAYSSSQSLKDENKDDVSFNDGGKISKLSNSPEIVSESSRREPPKTLSIRLPMPSSNDDSSQSRPVVSDKIKNLQAKMGDLKKILSPTDTPPLWRKHKDKIDEPDDEKIDSRDSEDGSSMSAPSTKSPTTITSNNEDTNIFVDPTRDPGPNSPLDDSGNSESAVSFDVPAQVEVLAITASKSRARIQAKRRPQSRHARHSALRKSGIDFDTVDNSSVDAGESDVSENTFSGRSENIPTVVTDNIDVGKTSHERLVETYSEVGRITVEKLTETSSSLAPEDKSELSFSKGSSLSLNKNTLLSPSTDEEDLFDVPPDLPEDPPKEDTLFGRAPILSPIDRSLVSKTSRSKHEKSAVTKVTVSAYEKSRILDASNDHTNIRTEQKYCSEKIVKESGEMEKSSIEKIERANSTVDKLTDPLRDDSHDPLKDPSQLFAFVTKTPSPEKGQGVSFKEDASLFTHLAKKAAEGAMAAASKKPILDLFADDTGGDLFSGTLAKTSKKSARSEKSLFDDIDEDEDGGNDLFGTGNRGKPIGEPIDIVNEPITRKTFETSGRESPKRSSIFAADDDDDLFASKGDKKMSRETEKMKIDDTEKLLFPATSKIAKDTRMQDIFGDQSSGEEDIFGKKKKIGSGKIPSGSIFSDNADDDDVDDIFGKRASIADSGEKIEQLGNRSSAKKTVTRDLKKTAEKIVEDPLSMLRDD